MCFNKVSENVYHSKMSHEGMGCVEWTETYCDEGVKFVSYELIQIRNIISYLILIVVIILKI